ncbi:MAG TPA: alpha-L-rhamnosidase C-terminal domain-containing protein [Candidatus Dormibacteraeota bacterium]
MPGFRVAWRGRWIWPALGDSEAGHHTAQLRRTLRLEAVPAELPVRATADGRFVLFVNGAEVMRGPARGAPERIAYEVVDVASHLRAGANEVLAVVRGYGEKMPWWRPAPGVNQLGRGAFALEAPAAGLYSDESWEGRATVTRLAMTPPDDIVPHAEIDGGSWSEWGPVSVVGRERFVPPEPSGLPQPTALPVELTEIGSVELPGTDVDPIAGYLAAREQTAAPGQEWRTFDAGQVTIGTVWVEAEGPGGAEVDVYAGEDLLPNGVVEASPRWYAVRHRLAGGPERWETFDGVGFRYLSVVPRGGANVKGVGAVERRFPTAGGAHFRCDDERLNRIWQVGARTLEVCATDAFVDCPGREQQAWVGDSYIHALLTLVSNSDWRLLRRHLGLCAQTPRADGFLPMIAAGDPSRPLACTDYSLHWVRALARYFEHSADHDIVRELLPVAVRVLDAFERFREADGLLHGVPGVFIDWAAVERGEVTGALDALYAAAVHDAAQLVESERLRAELEARAEWSRLALEQLWDPARGLYADVPGGRRFSQHTNALAIVAGSAPADRWAGILDQILDGERLFTTPSPADLPRDRALEAITLDPAAFGFRAAEHVLRAQPFASHFVHQAVAAAGRADLLPELCLRWLPQLEQGNTTFQEFWDARPGRSSRAHAWSATPTYDLTAHVLGVRPLEPGYARVAVRPVFGRLERLEGSVPTPHGAITVALTPEGGSIEVPPGVTVARREEVAAC